MQAPSIPHPVDIKLRYGAQRADPGPEIWSRSSGLRWAVDGRQTSGRRQCRGKMASTDCPGEAESSRRFNPVISELHQFPAPPRRTNGLRACARTGNKHAAAVVRRVLSFAAYLFRFSSVFSWTVLPPGEIDGNTGQEPIWGRLDSGGDRPLSAFIGDKVPEVQCVCAGGQRGDKALSGLALTSCTRPENCPKLGGWDKIRAW